MDTFTFVSGVIMIWVGLIIGMTNSSVAMKLYVIFINIFVISVVIEANTNLIERLCCKYEEWKQRRKQ